MQLARFTSFVVIVFALCAMPFLLVQASGVASAGFSAGFRAPLEQPWLLAMFLTIGMVSAALPKDGFLLVPFGCMMAVLAGTSVIMVMYKAQAMQLFVIGGGLLLLVSLLLSKGRLNQVMLIIAASCGFHVGMHLVVAMPVIAAPLFYLLGLLLAITLLLAIAVAFGITLIGDREDVQTPETGANAGMMQTQPPYGQ